ncbi:MAG: helix-turn-helix domain-containing protein [Pseudomonadota bacterium]
MTAPDLFDRFAKSSLSPDISDATRLRLQAMARYARVQAGDVPIIEEGSELLVFVISGSVKLVAQASQGREQVVAFHFAGDLLTLPVHLAHAYTLYALEDCELVYFPASQFFKLAVTEQGMANDILDRAMGALARCHEKTISLGRKNAQEKLASFLVTIAARLGSSEDGASVFELPMSRRDIGDSLGLTIETVSRQFSELRELGLLETSGRSGVRLLDPAGLEARAGHLAPAD